MKSKLLCVLLLLTLSIRAADESAPLTLTDGRTFAAWVITTETAGDVVVKYKGGMVKVSKKLLPENLQAKYPYDEDGVRAEQEASAAYRKQAAREGRLAAREWKQLKKFSGRAPMRTEDFWVNSDTWRIKVSAPYDYKQTSLYFGAGVEGAESFRIANSTEAVFTTTYGKKPGKYYLDVNSSSTTWTITIEELR